MNDFSFAKVSSIAIVGSGTATSICLFIVDSSVKGLLLLLVAAIVCRLMFKMSAAHRHMVWTAAIFGLVLMPLVALAVPQWKVLPTWLAAQSSIEQPVTSIPVESNFDNQPTIADSSILAPEFNSVHEEITPTNTKHEQDNPDVEESANELASSLFSGNTMASQKVTFEFSAGWIIGFWAAGFVMFSLPIWISIVRLKKIEAKSFEPDENGNDEKLVRSVRNICGQLNIQPPKILIGAHDAMPMVWTFLSSRLLIPASHNTWTSSKLESVLTHELTHLKRRDPTVFAFAMLSRALNWFNPLAWFAVKQLRIECEQACDDYVLQSGIQPDEYATHLLELSTNLSSSTSGHLAFAMSSKSKVESRIVSVLNDNINRRTVTVRRAACVILFAVFSVTMIASLAAHASETVEDPKDNVELADDEKEKIKTEWPNCVVDVGNLKTRTIEEEVKRFNLDSQSSPIGSQQKPVTEQGVLNAVKASIDNAKVAGPIKEILREIQKSKSLPPNVYLRRFTRFDDEANFHGVWWVRLVVVTQKHGNHFCKVESKTIYTRHYTQMERRQNRELGTTLINRISSYYKKVPQSIKRDTSLKTVKDVVAKFKKGLDADDLEALKGLVHWKGADKATRKFVEDEFNALIRANIKSVQYEGIRLKGDLRTWSAFQNYKPNLDVVGYLVVDVEADKAHNYLGTKLYLELGHTNGQLKLVCYNRDGDAKLPKKIPGGLSITGHNAMTRDGRLLMTTLVSNPSLLLSAHLSNEEVWHRDISKIRNLFKYDQQLKAVEMKKPSKAAAASEVQKFLPSIFEDKSSKQDQTKKKQTEKDEDLYSDERIISKRLDELFAQLKVKPRLRKSAHAKDIPEMYQESETEPGRYQKRPGILVVRYNPGIVYTDKMEHIWIQYIPSKRQYFVEHRFKLDDPYNDHVFGPYKGNPFKFLPAIEKEILDQLKSHNSSPTVMGRMMRMNDFDLAGRVLNIVDQALDFDLRLPDKNRMVKSLKRLIDIDWKKLDSMGSYAEKLASIRSRLTKFEKLVEDRTAEFPDSEYTATGRELPKNIDKKLWGKPVSGLRFAVVLGSTKFKTGDTVTATLVVENVSKENIKISVHDLVQDVRPEVTFDGKRVSTSNTWFSGWPPTIRYLIKPGKKVALAQSTLTSFLKVETKKVEGGFGLTSIPVTKEMIESGKKLNIDYTLRIGTSESWSRGDDDKWRVYTPGKGEWKGTVKAATIEASLVE